MLNIQTRSTRRIIARLAYGAVAFSVALCAHAGPGTPEAQRMRKPATGPAATPEIAFQQAREVATLTAKDPKAITPQEQDVIRRDMTALTLQGDAAQRARAAGYLGLMQAQKGDFAAALKTYSEINFKEAAAEDVPALRYNFGRALELGGRGTDAYTQYVQAMMVQHPPRAAVDGAVRTFKKADRHDDDDVRPVIVAAQKLRDDGALDAARAHVFDGLEAYRQPSQVEPLVIEMVRCLDAAGITPAQFDASAALDKLPSDRVRLTALAEKNPAAAKYIRAITLAYAPQDLGVKFGVWEPPAPFDAWTSYDGKKPMSSLLKRLGDAFAAADTAPTQGGTVNPDDARRAVERYWLAWLVDRENTDAALFVGSILRNHAQQVDPDGVVLKRFIDMLFEEKNALYRSGDNTIPVNKNLMGLHIVLAKHYESIDTPDALGKPHDGSPRTAGFHWYRAIDADRRIRELLKVTVTPTPGLYLNCGQYDERVKDPHMAATEYLEAAEGFLGAKNQQAAFETVKLVEKLGNVTDDQQKQRLNQIRSKLPIAAGDGRSRTETVATQFEAAR
jgi:hypothetical protein